MWVLSVLIAAIPLLNLQQEGECSLQAIYRKTKGKYLPNHVFHSVETKWEQECATHCLRDGLCASVNFQTSGRRKGLCELNSKTLSEAYEEVEDNMEFNHLDITERVRARVKTYQF